MSPDVSQMPAGRDLDRAVALAIFGTDAPHAIMPEWNLPPFSTDIEAAWELTVRVRLRIAAYVQVEDGHPRGGAFARFVRKGEAMVDRPTQTWEAAAETAPLAICRAALQAVGGAPEP